ncbi:MAG: B12-binding domain-containing radical SAM protein [Defluviitaleaceae bacterium]|nr:B12-binding domain-containing radical SAM protein [Defluviitaleaceae bacterium]MCL2274419.1 B12-binding domain-containing radical SAM protein [Defluviitaleaceae bacterium]
MPKQAEPQTYYYFPIGFGIVSASLKASGRDVTTLNLTYKNNPIELIQQTILNHNIDVVITGGLSGQYKQLREIIDIAKTIKPTIQTIVGGGIITAEPIVAMKALENADYGIIGEGEVVINKLAYVLETDGDKSIPGVITNGSDSYLPPTSEIDDLDCLPFPDYEGYDYHEMFESKFSAKKSTMVGLTIATSRSCPYSCTFCFHTSGKKYRRRSLDNVFKELDWLMQKYEFSHFLVLDELFGRDFAYVNDFCNRLKAYNLTFAVCMRMDMVTDELLDLMKDSGCVEIYFGVEHTEEKIIKSMNKKTSPALIKPVFTKCMERGITPYGNIIIGDLEETVETARSALSWWRENWSLKICILNMMTFPGSYIYKRACEQGIIKNPVKYLQAGCPYVNISKMNDHEWNEIKFEVSKTRILYEDGNESPNIANIVDSLNNLANCGRKVAVWPATNAIMRFFDELSPSFCKQAWFLNINLNHQHLSGELGQNIKYNVHTPDIINQEKIDVVICPRSALKEDITKMCNTTYPSVTKIITVPELEEMATWI